MAIHAPREVQCTKSIETRNQSKVFGRSKESNGPQVYSNQPFSRVSSVLIRFRKHLEKGLETEQTVTIRGQQSEFEVDCRSLRSIDGISFL